MKEFDIISTYFQRPARHASIVKSVGDDCAVLSVPESCQLVVSMDTLVSGRHFPENTPPEHIATRAFCTCLSDLAAMGATPRWFTLGLTLPEADTSWVASFSQSLFNIADDYQCELIGGDTTQGPLTITLQVHGFVDCGRALTRDAGVAGDAVFVTGFLGDGAAGLELLLNNPSVDDEARQYLMQRFYRPEPQVAAGKKMTEYAHAAIDISDGLLADLQHIAKASHIDIEVDVQRLPISPACQTIGGDKAVQYALTGGDDYQIAFTVPQKNIDMVNNLIVQEEFDATYIGQLIACKEPQPSVRCLLNGELFSVNNEKGYQHFAS